MDNLLTFLLSSHLASPTQEETEPGFRCGQPVDCFATRVPHRFTLEVMEPYRLHRSASLFITLTLEMIDPVSDVDNRLTFLLSSHLVSPTHEETEPGFRCGQPVDCTAAQVSASLSLWR